MSVATSCFWVFMTTPPSLCRGSYTQQRMPLCRASRKDAIQRVPLCWASQKDALAAVTNYFRPVPNLPYNDSGVRGFRGALMKSSVVKRSIVIDGHKTSVSLEDPFWADLKEIAHTQQVTLSELVTKIDGTREQSNLSSAIRLFVLQRFRNEDK